MMHWLKDSFIFRALPEFESLEYAGDCLPSLRHFRTTYASRAHSVVLCHAVAAEDRELWDSYRELLVFSLKTAEAQLEGSYEFKLLTFTLHEKLKSFNPSNISIYSSKSLIC